LGWGLKRKMRVCRRRRLSGGFRVGFKLLRSEFGRRREAETSCEIKNENMHVVKPNTENED
jgi:hypothetical protein